MSKTTNQDSSSLPNKGQLLSLAQAKQHCLAQLGVPEVMEMLPIRNALGRITARDVIAPINVPSHTNSAMDGYAMQKNSVKAGGVLSVIDTAYAGSPSKQSITAAECIKVMTGAVMPTGADFVVPQECVEQRDKHITIGEYAGGSNVRQAGEDLTKGGVALSQGRRLNAVDIGLLASLGIAQVSVWRTLRVAFFSTGDELKPLTEPLDVGQIYDSNRYSLDAVLQNINVDTLDMGMIEDDPGTLKTALLNAASADVIITTGGVSVGEADFVKQVLQEIGDVSFWKIAIKPGRPLTFGRINSAYFFGLPGNPVAAMVTFYQIVQPFLKRLSGQLGEIEPLTVSATTLADIRKLAGRVEFVRGNVFYQAGELVVRPIAKQGSGVLSSLSQANCFIVLDETLDSVRANDKVSVQPFYGLM